ncbi:hypothetical protein FE257_005728 [Aspergillus nanangensis]|uniref:Mannitol 2-dehydrogenase n=1 Tax=Aspergillus nanangensis TaxID=2582783 RepID=A0AAD4CRW9_ASPNN|nr:hypothetical protein FE257_005728 [Aspergillus nanangensis]
MRPPSAMIDPNHRPTTKPLKLSNENLPQIATTCELVKIPTYPRGSAVKEGIVHIGVGGFHRAHMAVYINQLMQKHNINDYGICGVGLQPADSQMRDALESQNHLYTVIERSAVGSAVSVIGSINSYLFAPDDPEAVIAKMAHPDTHIVSLSITESGYYYNKNTHELQVDHPDIQSDLANEKIPRTTFGFLYAALERRYKQGLRPFTVISCDNIQKNGSIARLVLESLAYLRNPNVAKWISEQGSFPNTMVDRITPQTSAADRKDLADNFGIEDAWPVVTEPFKQWVIEDQFSEGRPPFEKVGIQIVDIHTVEQFEKHKLRLLNASHSAIGYPGQLAGFLYVHEVMENAFFRRFIWQMVQGEVKPLLSEIPSSDVGIDEYCSILIDRFSNPTIMDQLSRVCLNASGKIPQFIIPSISEAIRVGGPLRRLCFVLAAWFRYIDGIDDHGRTFDVDDPMCAELQAATSPDGLLGIKTLFGDDLRSEGRFLQEITTAMQDIGQVGVMRALPKYID